MIAIVDYGMGNLRSVQKAFERVGYRAVISSEPAEVAAASKVVLPGVGAFAQAIAELRRRGLVRPVLDAIEAEKPFLGICLGLQLLFDVGYEDGVHQGLGVLRGEVVRFRMRPEYSVPHMGWNQVWIRRPAPILEGIADGSFFYFAHSYYVVLAERGIVAAQTDYPEPFCSMIWRANMFATQFHPEKSQSVGLSMLKSFAELPPAAEVATG